MSQVLIPTGRWKVQAESANEKLNLRLSGRAFSDALKLEQRLQTVVLTHDQAQELVSTLNMALRELELELQRSASLARVAEGEAATDGWDYSLSMS